MWHTSTSVRMTAAAARESPAREWIRSPSTTACTRSAHTCSACRWRSRSKGARTMTMRRFWFAAGLGVALAAAGCQNDSLLPPHIPTYTGGAMFQRYVSLGNSITAGFQAGGINDSTQALAYPVKVAAAMGGEAFYRPSLTYVPSLGVFGCPPPIDTLFTASGVPHRQGGG